MSKYNIPKIRAEYVNGDWRSFTEYCNEKGFAYTTLVKKIKIKEIEDEKAKKWSKVGKEKTEKSIAKISDAESEINKVHYDTSKALIAMVRDEIIDKETGKFKKLKIKDISLLTSTLRDNQQIQRLAKGMPGSIGKQDITVSPGNRTEISKMEDGIIQARLESGETD